MIECKKLSVNYGKKTILHEVDLCAEDGTVTVLLGKNGSGKTTLLRTVSGVWEKYRGSILLDGAELSEISKKTRAGIVSILPQFLPRPAITVEELVSCGRYPFRKAFAAASEEDRIAVEDSLQKTGMADKRNRMVCHLSGGERQLSYTAMLLAQDTKNVLFDEPTASLDTGYRQQTMELVRTLKESGKCVILSLHDLTDAVSIADRILVLDHGASVFSGTAEEFIGSGVPEKVFGMQCHRFSEGKREFRVFIPCEK